MLNVKIQSSVVFLLSFKNFRTTIPGVISKDIFVLALFFFFVTAYLAEACNTAFQCYFSFFCLGKNAHEWSKMSLKKYKD